MSLNIASARVEADSVKTSKLFCDTLDVGNTFTFGPSHDLRTPRVLDIDGTLTIENGVTLSNTAQLMPTISEFGGESVASYVQFVNPGIGFGGKTNDLSRVPTGETYGVSNGSIILHHSPITVDVDDASQGRIVRAIDVDHMGHITRIETVDVSLFFEQKEADFDAAEESFVLNAVATYNDPAPDNGSLFLDWYRRVTEDASRNTAQIRQGRFLSLPITTHIPVDENTTDLFRGVIATRSGYVVMIPFNAEIVWSWNPDTNVEKTYEVGPKRYAGGCLLPDDRILFAPYDEGATVQIYDPITNTLMDLPDPDPDMTGFWGAMLHPTGHVVLAAGPRNNIVILDVKTLQPVWTYELESDVSSDSDFESYYAGCVMDARSRIWLVPYDNPRADVIEFDAQGGMMSFRKGPEVTNDPAWEVNRTDDVDIEKKRCIGGSLAKDGSIVLSSYNVRPQVTFVRIDSNEENVSQASVTYTQSIDDPGTQIFSNSNHGTFVLPDGTIGNVPYERSAIQTTSDFVESFGLNTLVQSEPGNRYGGACLLRDGRVFFCPSNVSNPGIYIQPIPPSREMVYHPVWNHA